MIPVKRVETTTGYLSIVQWKSSGSSYDYQNLAVILISGNSSYHGMKCLEREKMPKEIPNLGNLHSWMTDLAQKISAVDLPELHTFSRILSSSVNVTTPTRCNVPASDWDRCLEGLWLLFVAPR